MTPPFEFKNPVIVLSKIYFCLDSLMGRKQFLNQMTMLSRGTCSPSSKQVRHPMQVFFIDIFLFKQIQYCTKYQRLVSFTIIKNHINKIIKNNNYFKVNFYHILLVTRMLQSKENKIEILLNRVGGESRYQYIIFAVFALKWMIAAMILFSLNFFFFVPDFTCTDEEMVGFDTCEDYVCSLDDENFWISHFEQPVPNSIALDYGITMVCSKAWLSSLLQSMSYLGSLFGYIIMSHVGDNIGRKKGELVSWIICIIGQIIMLASFNLYMVAVGSILLGFGANAAITLHYSFFKQLVLGKTRQRMIIAIQLAFSLGVSLISLLSYFISQWKYTLGFFILIPSIVAIFLFKIVEETPEFTLKKGYESFRKSFNRIAKINNNQELQADQVAKVLQNYSLSQQQSQVTFLDLFRYKSLRYIAIVTALMNFVIQFVFDGTLLSLNKFGINVYFDQILVGFVEVFASLFGAYIVPKVKRKFYITIALFIIGVVSVIMGIQSLTYNHVSNQIDYHTIIEMILIAILRFLINSVWGVFFVFVSELFPTEVSSLSYGWVSVIGTVGAAASPYIRLFTANLTMFVIAILCFLVVVAVRTLEETKGKTITTRIKERQEVQQHYNKKISILSE